MPGMVMFRRRWAIGSDDFVLPASLLLMGHLLQIALVLPISLSTTTAVAGSNSSSNSSNSSSNSSSSTEASTEWTKVDCQLRVKFHTVAHLCLMLLCSLNEAGLAKASMSGSIMETDKRQSVAYLLYLRLAVFVVEICYTVFGTAALLHMGSVCPQSGTIVSGLVGVLLLDWSLMTALILGSWCSFDRGGGSWLRQVNFQESVARAASHRRGVDRGQRTWRHRRTVRRYERIWTRRVQLAFCCLGKDRNSHNTITEVAKLVTEFFRNTDVVPSDIVAGLLLLGAAQRQRRQQMLLSDKLLGIMSSRPITADTVFLNKDYIEDKELMLEAEHYMKLSLAAYGCPMVAYAGSCCCCLCNLRLGAKSCREAPMLQEDRCSSTTLCGRCCSSCTHSAVSIFALLRMHGVPPRDLEVTFVGRRCQSGAVPFYVAAEPARRTVAVCIRGTLSLHDVLTDLRADTEPLLADTEPLQADKNDSGWFGHRGIVLSARCILRTLVDMRLLQAAARRLDSGSGGNYRLVITGHSLGAGTAAVLGLLLRPLFGQRLRVLAFSPPGGLLCPNAAAASRQFVTSFVVGKDIVPRIGLPQMQRLQTELLQLVSSCQLPKWRILASSLFCCCCCCCGGHSGCCQLQQQLQQQKQKQQQQDGCSLQLPGKIVHIVRSGAGTKPQEVRAVRAKPEDFDELVVAASMISDHMPDTVLKALTLTADQFRQTSCRAPLAMQESMNDAAAFGISSSV